MVLQTMPCTPLEKTFTIPNELSYVAHKGTTVSENRKQSSEVRGIGRVPSARESNGKDWPVHR